MTQLILILTENGIKIEFIYLSTTLVRQKWAYTQRLSDINTTLTIRHCGYGGFVLYRDGRWREKMEGLLEGLISALSSYSMCKVCDSLVVQIS